MALVAGPYGMKAVQSIVASPNNMAVRQFRMDPANSSTLIYAGDVAQFASSGYVQKDTGTTSNTAIGVFDGFEYTSLATGQRLQSNYWPGSAAVDTTRTIWAYVHDDPFTLFQIQGYTSSTSFATIQAYQGMNAAITQTAGNTTFGRSQNSLTVTTIATTATFPLKIIDFARTPDNDITAASASNPIWVDFLVRFNTHGYLTALGV